MAKLTPETLQQGLAKLNGWSIENNELRKRFTFKSFLPGIDFVDRIATAAEHAGHHPNITIKYNVVDIALSTHSEGGITDKDLSLAKAIDRIHARPT